jgi:hypothetical protein
MTRNLRHIALVFVASSLVLGAWVVPARAIHPFGGFRLMPVFRITPAMNGMTGTMGGMQMMPTFNVQTGVVAMPRFHHEMEFRRMELRNMALMNGLSNSFSSGIGYGGMTASFGSYPSSGSFGQMTSVPQFATEASTMPPEVSRTLSAAALSNNQGKLNWPIGLQALFPATTNWELINQIDARLQTAALQKANGGSVDSDLIKETSRDAKKLRAMLQQREPYLQAPTYREADRFLKNLDTALKEMQGPTTAAAAK